MLSLEEIKEINEGTMMEALGIEYLELREGFVYARMFVKKELSQPYGMLHGGASMAMAGFMYSVLPVYVRFPSGARAMVPPSLATRRQFITAERSAVCFLMGMGARKKRSSEEIQPSEKISSVATK